MPDQPPVSPSAGHPSTSPVEAHALPTTYANVFRASGSAEELILDLGLDAHRPTGDDREPVVMLQRLVLTWGNARRLAVLLQDLLRHHDKTQSLPASAGHPPASPST